MNLRDYIGDTRTESLPAGFLRSIKIKYRHEESHVFPRAVGPSSRESKRVENEPTVEDSGENKEEDDKTSEIKEKQLPGFMSWSVPSRLLNQIQEKEHIASDEKIDETNADLKSRDDGASITRELTSLSIRALKSSTSRHSHSCDEFKVDRQSSGGRTSNSVEHIHKSQPNVREGSGTISPPRLQRRQKSKATVRNVPKSSASQRSEKSEVEVRECKSGWIVQNTSCSKRCKMTNESERGLTSSCSRNKSDDMLVKESVRVIKSSSLKKENGSDNQDNKSERNATSRRSALISEHKLKELPKLHVSLPKRSPKSSKVEEKGRLLPHLKRAKGKTTNTTEQNETPSKLPQTPERIEKINTWVKKSTHKEREAAFNLLSTFITSEKINSSRARKERIKIALKALERKETSGKPLRMNDMIRNLAVITLDQQRSTNHTSNDHEATKRQREELKTWHHMAACHDTGEVNKSAMFAQPSKSYQRHFSIHPEWGLHTQVNMAKC